MSMLYKVVKSTTEYFVIGTKSFKKI